jgi:diketogulonate reductase-like aldo/keto reductase
MGEEPRKKKEEQAALRLGIDLGMTLIDTAEMYGEGGAEELIGAVISGRRDEVFLVSKFYPQNATREGVIAACERSLKRLDTDRIDLYLLHWRGAVPFQQTLDGLDELLEAGKIRHWGVSNFALADIEDLIVSPRGSSFATNQVLYNLMRRGVEWNLLPWLSKRNIPVMAYSPVEQGRLLNNPSLEAIASRHDATPAQIALAWVLRQRDVITIPKASRRDHVVENWNALQIHLADEDLEKLDAAFPPPDGPRSLEMI